MEKQAYELVGNSEDFLWFYKIRKEIIVDTLKNEVPDFSNKKLLDIGCGSGDILVSISKYIPNSFGLEPYEYSHQKYKNIIHQPIFNNNFDDNSFDIITFFDVMEHIEDENKFLYEVKRLINKSNCTGGGVYFDYCSCLSMVILSDGCYV